VNSYIIIILLVILGGIVTSVWGIRVLQTSRKASQWPTVEGVVTESEPESEHDELLPHIRFEYEADKQARSNTVKFPPDTNPLPEFARSYIEKFPVGQRVLVYYNPENADESTLEPSLQGDWMILAMGLLMAVGGVAAIALS